MPEVCGHEATKLSPFQETIRYGSFISSSKNHSSGACVQHVYTSSRVERLLVIHTAVVLQYTSHYPAAYGSHTKGGHLLLHFHLVISNYYVLKIIITMSNPPNCVWETGHDVCCLEDLQ